MSGRQQRVMVQPIVRSNALFHRNPNLDPISAECYFQKSTASASQTESYSQICSDR
jgi:hypothetical protein